MKTFKEYLGEGKMSDMIIHDSETLSKEEFTKKHGKELADEYYESVAEAVGDAAAPIYDLIDELGSHQIVLDELIRYLDVDQIADFVADFRRHNDMGMDESNTVSSEEMAILKKLAGL